MAPRPVRPAVVDRVLRPQALGLLGSAALLALALSGAVSVARSVP